jgi:hypothetical protein
MSPHHSDEGWVGPLYSSIDPAAAAMLQELLEERGVPATTQMRAWGNLPAPLIGRLQPTVYQVLISSTELEAHRGLVDEALAEVRRELGEDSEAF